MRSKTTTMKCGTCEFWTGSRTPVFNANGQARIDIFDDVGNCENVHSGFFEKPRKQTLKCCRFSKWTEIL